jgi:hypothetical protein
VVILLTKLVNKLRCDALQVAMLESCRDRNVVQFLGSCSDGPQTLLVTE